MRNPTYYSTSLQIHQITLYVQTSQISTSPQWSYDNVVLKSSYPSNIFLCLGWWYFFLVTDIRTCIPPVKSVFSLLILPNLDWFTHCTPQHPLGISYLSSLSANWLVITLTITLIYLEISSLSGNKLVVNLTLTLTLTKKPIETENYDLFLFSLLYFLITTITILWVTYWYN